MSRYCDHYAATKELLDRFFHAIDGDDPESALSELRNELWAARGDLIHHEIDHLWEDIHRCLTDDLSEDMDFDSGEYPLYLCIHGGEWLGTYGWQTVTLVHVDEVAELLPALEVIDQGWLRQKLLGMQGRLARYDNLDEERIGYVWEEFTSLREFYRKAADAGLPVVCTIAL